MLGESHPLALKRFISNERSLKSKNALDQFNTNLQEYEELHHAEKVPPEDLLKPAPEHFYLPMCGVVKESSTTTKLRVVFDASAKSSSGVSLNDQLLPTPSLCPLLTSVLNKFRFHRIALSSDISKMFREVLLDSTEKDFYRFLCRSPGGKLEDWRMHRLTFGIASSPYLASQVLKQTAIDHETEFPTAAAIVKSTFYVDDCLTGAKDVPAAIQFQQDLFHLLKKAGMTLCKWRSNSTQVMEYIPEELREKDKELIVSDPSDCAKTLGIHWHTTEDLLFVAIPTLDDKAPTKRSVASSAARLYDVLGWFAPITLYIKTLLQQLWQADIGRDEPIPANLIIKWDDWKTTLPLLGRHPIPRCYYSSSSIVREVQLHSFSDASQHGYGGVIYIRLLHQDSSITVSLMTAKTRVAPLKTISIP